MSGCRAGGKGGPGTYNARCETVEDKPSFRDAWREKRFAVVPMLNYFEPCWESGRAVRWRIERADGLPHAGSRLA
ncbi:MAG: SOS response-associated peptidase family protein [Burkholderiaceae bacterium]